ncbi:MAG: hypothetical protein ACD_79C00228G0001, partial [uncultured bacterium]
MKSRFLKKSSIVFLISIFFFLFPALLSSDTGENSVLKSKISLDDEISVLKNDLTGKSGQTLNNIVKKLFKAHKKRIKLDLNDETAILDFVYDDLKYGEGKYAVFLLSELTESPKASLKLASLNLEPDRQGKKIRMKSFTKNPLVSFFRIISGKNSYRFEKTKVNGLIRKINEKELSNEDRIVLSDIKIELTGTSKTSAPVTEITVGEKQEAVTEPVKEEPPQAEIQ